MPQLSYYLPVLMSGQNESELGPKHFYSREHFLFLVGSLIWTIFSLVDILKCLVYFAPSSIQHVLYN